MHRNEIIVEQVSHRFANGLLAVEDMSFLVEPGQFVVIVGPSGCGKTTILNIIAGLVEKQTGIVTVGERLPRAGRHDVAYMFAQDALLPWRRVINNVLFGLEIHTGTRHKMTQIEHQHPGQRAKRRVSAIAHA